ncbi:hypothetical protein BaRGS_00028463 [Batillaria attramentaria]|uniref:Uncharacterized protein n=1 Tax=Batillaria attramentaria TaxID=370345 RepID=A0ABD0K0E4_9CAEN
MQQLKGCLTCKHFVSLSGLRSVFLKDVSSQSCDVQVRYRRLADATQIREITLPTRGSRLGLDAPNGIRPPVQSCRRSETEIDCWRLDPSMTDSFGAPDRISFFVC